MSEKKIAETLGLRSLEEVRSEEQPEEEAVEQTEDGEILPDVVDDDDDALPTATGDADTLRDIETARKNIEGLIGKGTESLDELIDIAKQSESPRAFEVVSTMMKTLLDANKDFIEMSMKKKYEKEDPAVQQTNVTNNNLILSTADLLQHLKDAGDK